MANNRRISVSMAQKHAQEDATERLASLLVGRTIEAVHVELHPSGDNTLLLRLGWKVYNHQGDMVTKIQVVRVQFNDLGMFVKE
jgi:hypothetical protein